MLCILLLWVAGVGGYITTDVFNDERYLKQVPSRQRGEIQKDKKRVHLGHAVAFQDVNGEIVVIKAKRCAAVVLGSEETPTRVWEAVESRLSRVTKTPLSPRLTSVKCRIW